MDVSRILGKIDTCFRTFRIEKAKDVTQLARQLLDPRQLQVRRIPHFFSKENGDIMKYTQEKEIVVETNRKLIIRRYRNETESWCTECVQLVRWLTPEELALVVGGSSRTIYRQAENGQAHFFETPDGLLLICLNSILANSTSSLL